MFYTENNLSMRSVKGFFFAVFPPPPHRRLGHKLEGVLCDGESDEVVASTVVNCTKIDESECDNLPFCVSFPGRFFHAFSQYQSGSAEFFQE